MTRRPFRQERQYFETAIGDEGEQRVRVPGACRVGRAMELGVLTECAHSLLKVIASDGCFTLVSMHVHHRRHALQR